MSTYHVSARDEGIRPIVRAAFPSYNGTKARIEPFKGPMGVNSYWDGGSRDYFALVRLADCRSMGLPTSHPCFDRRPDGSPMGALELRELPQGIALVEHSIFCGRDTGITVHVRPDDLNRLALPDAPQLTDDERIVLDLTGLKSSYNGISQYRRHVACTERGMTGERYETAKASLIERKLLNRAGAITTTGRNARSAQGGI